MIVMGSKGRTGLSHILLGSKAEQIVRLSPIPVTIVKAQTEQDT
jgi:nucleotide-binding universal stress UspA family protein